MRRLCLAMALATALLPPPGGAALAQGYGPTTVTALHYRMYRGDALDIEVGEAFDWAETDSEAVAAFMREGNRLRLVAIKPGKAEVVLTREEIVVWKAEVIVR